MMKPIVPIIVLLFILTPVFVHGKTFRCGNETVSVGETKYEVLIRCGEPDYRDVGLWNPYTNRVQYEIWYYDCGPHRLIRILRFHNSQLTQVEIGGYGSRRGLPCPTSSEWKERKDRNP